MTTAPTDAAWRDVLLSRQSDRASGGLRPFPGLATKTALLDGGSEFLMLDSTEMSATAVISTPTPDRSDDVVEPQGVLLDNYAKNPVVYFDHGFSGMFLPIGKSEDADGNLTVTVTPEGIEATTYFAQSSFEACQIFELIAEKIIRSTSVQLRPIVAKVRSEQDNMRPGLLISEWELLEYSWVGIPDNPEAVRKVLDTNNLAGKPICEPLLKSLYPFAAQRTRPGTGFDLEALRMAKTTLAKSMTKADPKPDDEKPADDKPVDDAPVVPSPDEGAPDDEPEVETEPPSAKAMAAFHAGLKGLMDSITATLKQVENPPVMEFFAATNEKLAEMLGEAESTFSAAYEGKTLGKADGEPDDEAGMAKFFRQSALNRLPVSHVIANLKSLGTAKNLKPEQRDLIANVSSRLTKMLAGAKAVEPAKPVEDTDTAKLVADLAALQSQFKTLQTKLADTVPYRRQAG